MDYGLLGGLGEGLKEGVKTYLGVKERNEDNRRQKQALAMQAMNQGYQYNPQTDEFTPSQGLLDKKQLEASQNKTALEELDPTSEAYKKQAGYYKNLLNQIEPGAGDKIVTEGVPLSDLKDKSGLLGNYITSVGKEKALQASLNKQNEQMSFRDQQLQERNDFRAHQQVLNKVKSDKTLNDSVIKAQNLTNAISNVEKTGVITPQDMADMQALAVANMGVGGQSSASERAERYAKTMGIKASEALQFLTGQPQSIGMNNPLFNRYKEIMRLETENFKDRAAKRIDALTSGNKSVYKRNPELASDLDEIKQNITGQLPGGGNYQAAPPGLINKQADFPRTVTNGKQQATVSNQKELEEAMKEGFR